MPNVYIDADVASGGTGEELDPYGGWTEAWAAEDGNIDPGETWNFYFRGTTADTITAPIVLNGWPTAGAGDVILNFLPWPGADDGQYTGDANYSTSHYRLEGALANNRALIEIEGDDETTDVRQVNIENLQFTSSGTGSVAIGLMVEDGASGAINIRGNRIKVTGGTNFARAIRVAALTSAISGEFVNNLICYANNDNMSAFNLNDAAITLDIYNNTVVYSDASGGEDGVDDVSGVTTDIQGNVFYAEGGTGFIELDIAGTATIDYNAHVEAADRGANGTDVVQADFTSFGTGDADELTPAASQTNNWATVGETNADNSKVPTVDIRGNARNTGAGQNTAIGCFAAAGEGGSGGGIIPQVYHARHHNRAM